MRTAMLAAVEALALDLGPVSVNAVIPDLIDTPLLDIGHAAETLI